MYVCVCVCVCVCARDYVREYSKSFSATGYGADPKRPNTMAAITQGDAVNQLFAVVS